MGNGNAWQKPITRIPIQLKNEKGNDTLSFLDDLFLFIVFMWIKRERGKY